MDYATLQVANLQQQLSSDEGPVNRENFAEISKAALERLENAKTMAVANKELILAGSPLVLPPTLHLGNEFYQFIYLSNYL